MNRILSLALADFKIIFRDPSLKSFLFLPLLLFALIIWAVPSLIESYDFLEDYLSLILVVGVIENTQMFSFISSMVLVDEKESNVNKVFGIVPLKKGEFILSRFILPYSITVLLNIILLSVQTLIPISIAHILMISFISALVVPSYAMAVNSFVKNRMQAMVYIKAINMLVLLPIAAFFIPGNYKHLFGILPTHWLFQGIEDVALAQSPLLMLGLALLFFVLLLLTMARLFSKRHFN